MLTWANVVDVRSTRLHQDQLGTGSIGELIPRANNFPHQGANKLADQSRLKEIGDLLAKRFIARPDVKAAQWNDRVYSPVMTREEPRQHVKFTRDDLNNHILGRASFGHYMIGTDNQVKLFAFDIDLEKSGMLPDTFNANPDVTTDVYLDYKDYPLIFDAASNKTSTTPGNPRDFWYKRFADKSPSTFAKQHMIKTQFRMLANELAVATKTLLDIPVAMAYSGSKGVHVYGFTGRISAAEAREAMKVVLESVGTWQPARGDNFYTRNPHPDDAKDPFLACGQYSLEIFPKQDDMSGGKEYGNLMRLPLGVNKKAPRDKAFFLDPRAPLTEFVEMDPIEALTTDDPWRFPGN